MDTRILQSILYVEDDKNTQSELKDFLQAYCEYLYLADNGAKGLAAVEKYQPELIVTDIAMPVMSGLTMMSEIRKQGYEIPVIFLTAFSDNEYLHQAINYHANAYIDKPVDLDLLEESIQRVMQTLNLQKRLQEQTQRQLDLKAEFETILNNTHDGIAILDKQGHFKYVNHHVIKLFGLDEQTLLQRSFIDLTDDHHKDDSEAFLQQARNSAQAVNFQQHCITGFDTAIIVDVTAVKMPNKANTLLSIHDITEKVHKEQKIKEYLKMIDEHVITSSTDLYGSIISSSTAFCRISGYSKEELIGSSHNIIRHPDTPKRLYEEMWEKLKNDEVWEGEIKNLAKDGSEYWVKSEISPTYDDKGIKVGYISVREDITNLKIVEELTLVDPLTEVYNRRAFNEIFPKFLQTAKRHNELVCFAVADIDYFKLYNDHYGHIDGDEALVAVAQAISCQFKRGDDYVFRLGGEEFGVLFKVKSADHVQPLLNDLVKSIEGLHLAHCKSLISDHVTLSMGAIHCHALDCEDMDSLYKAADELLFKAKEQGRNRVLIKGA